MPEVKIEIGNKLPISKEGKVNWYRHMKEHNKKIDESKTRSRKSELSYAAKEILKMYKKGGQIISSSLCHCGEEYERIFGHK